MIAAAMLMSLSLGGCYNYVAEHPEKSKQQFYNDKAICEQKARDFAMERREEVTYSDEINFSNRCMRNLGWEYHFRKNPK